MDNEKILWCIPCEKSIVLMPFIDKNVHSIYSRTSENIELDWCDGPFASCPPPEQPEDWELLVTEPDENFLVASDQSANELMIELGVL